ncbi:hypothetical protein C8T65DRAFT_283655 [Cerioporus squamosus]|nr:hypothetical protein C8T65DRAFT_283655 [Cerioporus squamosus]
MLACEGEKGGWGEAGKGREIWKGGDKVSSPSKALRRRGRHTPGGILGTARARRGGGSKGGGAARRRAFKQRPYDGGGCNAQSVAPSPYISPSAVPVGLAIFGTGVYPSPGASREPRAVCPPALSLAAAVVVHVAAASEHTGREAGRRASAGGMCRQAIRWHSRLHLACLAICFSLLALTHLLTRPDEEEFSPGPPAHRRRRATASNEPSIACCHL